MKILRIPNVRKLLIVLSVPLLFLLVALFSERSSRMAFEGQDFVITSSSDEATSSSGIRLSVLMTLLPPPSTQRSAPLVRFNSLNVEVGSTLLPIPDEICVDRVFFLEDLAEQYVNRSYVPITNDLAKPLCFTLDEPRYVVESYHGSVRTSIATRRDDSGSYETEDVKLLARGYLLKINSPSDIPLNKDSGAFWYPFDHYESTFSMLLKYQLLGDGLVLVEDEMSPGVTMNSDGEFHWDVKIAGIDDLVLDKPHGLMETDVTRFHRVSISFSRPIVYRVVYPLVMVTMFLLISILSLAEQLDTFLEGAVAVLFGIFGIREVLLPSVIKVRTILDVVILDMYIAFAVVLILFLPKILSPKKRDDAESVEQAVTQPAHTVEPTSLAANEASQAEKVPRKDKRSRLYILLMSLAIGSILVAVGVKRRFPKS